jgi:hypothetical protein
VSEILVDDRILGALLRNEPVEELPRTASINTTGLWYVRLCTAYFASSVDGTLSRPFRELPPTLRARAVDQLLELPLTVGLISLRHLAPSMGRLRRDHARLNVLALEVLGAATTLDADVFTAVPSPELESSLIREGRRCQLVAVV